MENLEKNEIALDQNDSDVRSLIAKNLTELRKKNKLTQLELATKFNYSDKAISKWERGEAIPDVITLLELAKLYGVTLDYFVSKQSEKQNHVIKQRKINKKLIITLISSLLPWLISIAVFMVLSIFNIFYWLAFLWAIPATCIILIVFNGIWGKWYYKFPLITALTWSILTCTYLQLYLYNYNIWLLFVMGIPAQIAIILWALLQKK